MSWRFHGRAEVDPEHPRAWATCDRCGLLYNHQRLHHQFQWAGTRLTDLNILVCTTCLDKPQEQLRVFALPPDPDNIINPRVEPYATDETSWRVTEAGDRRVTEAGVARVIESGYPTGYV